MNFYLNKWTVVPSDFGIYLIHDEKPKMFDIIECRQMVRGLMGNYNGYKYYGFYEQERVRFIFVTKESMNFPAIEARWGCKKTALLVEGALYDVKTSRFVTLSSVAPSCKDVFYKFVIYDGGTPNVVYNDVTREYVILYHTTSDVNTIRERRSKIIPTVVTYANSPYANSIKRNRAIFFEPARSSEGQSDFIILEKEMTLTKEQDKASFIRCIYDDQAREEQFSNLHSYSVINELLSKASNANIGEVSMTSYIIGGDTCLIVRSPYGDFGELILLIVAGEVFYQNEISFYDYEVVDTTDTALHGHLVLKLYWEKSDIENGISYFDVTERITYERLNNLYA